MDAMVSMSRASLREVTQATLGAWAAGFQNVLNRPFTRVAIPAVTAPISRYGSGLPGQCGSRDLSVGARPH